MSTVKVCAVSAIAVAAVALTPATLSFGFNGADLLWMLAPWAILAIAWPHPELDHEPSVALEDSASWHKRTGSPQDDESAAQRFAIELATPAGGSANDWLDLGRGLADDARAGMCSNPDYLRGLSGDPALANAWASGCLLHFADAMSADQIAAAKQVIVANATHPSESVANS